MGQQEWRLTGANLCCTPARFELENQLRLEQNQRCLFASNTAVQWLDIRLQMIGVVVVTAIAGVAIIQHQKQLGNPGGLPGIVLCLLLGCGPGVPRLLVQGCITHYTRVGSKAPAPFPLQVTHSVMLQLMSLVLRVPILEWDPRFWSADFSFVSLSCHQDPISFSASNVHAYGFVLTGVVGLALSYALSFTNLLSGLISSFTLTETMMVSVERTEEYTTDIPMEPQNKLVQVKAQICSPELAHLLALCLALASWGDHRIPVDGWRALTHRNHLDHSSFTNTSPGGDETLAGVGEVWNDGKG